MKKKISTRKQDALLLLSDAPSYGTVALKMSEAVLRRMHYEVFSLPTALISNTLNFGKTEILDTTAYLFRSLSVWKELGFDYSALFLGFVNGLAQAEQLYQLAKEEKEKGKYIFFDPIMADGGKLYHGLAEEDVLSRRKLMAVSDCIFPNKTEACLLAGRKTVPEDFRPEEAKAKIEAERKAAGITEPKNLEEQAISLVGSEIYEKLIKGYTKKQWGRDCKELPASIIKRLPVRLTYDNNYFNALFQGIPKAGYTKLVENMLSDIPVELSQNFFENREMWMEKAEKIVFTGPIDAFYEYSLGELEYRKVDFVVEELPMENYQGNAAVNYTDEESPYTRIIEHKWFTFGKDQEGKDIPTTIISKEYSAEWKKGEEPYYPVNDEKNQALYQQYKALSEKEEKVLFGGRLGEYKYYDMDVIVASALDFSKKHLG